MIIRIIICSLGIVCCSSAVKEKGKNTKGVKSDSEINIQNSNRAKFGSYDFLVPSETHVLNSKLGEISSLAFDPADNTFLTNDDESGHFYILNGRDFGIKEEISFARMGDFEGIEKRDNNIFVCKSTGTIFIYDLLDKETKILKNALKASNDVEGLCYLKDSHSLLLACKGQPLEKKKGAKSEKCVYRFDLEKEQLDSDPYLTITDKALVNYVEKEFAYLSKSKLKKSINRIKNFAPSGIEIHPETGAYYLVSGRGSTVVVFGKDKKLQEVAFLNAKTIPQPEGITFDGDSNLYIATEGQGFSGKVFKFASK